jgi:hypothetical protein
MLRTHRGRLGLRVHTLKPRAFPNGFRFYERRLRGGAAAFTYAPADNVSSLVVVHREFSEHSTRTIEPASNH